MMKKLVRAAIAALAGVVMLLPLTANAQTSCETDINNVGTKVPNYISVPIYTNKTIQVRTPNMIDETRTITDYANKTIGHTSVRLNMVDPYTNQTTFAMITGMTLHDYDTIYHQGEEEFGNYAITHNQGNLRIVGTFHGYTLYSVNGQGQYVIGDISGDPEPDTVQRVVVGTHTVKTGRRIQNPSNPWTVTYRTKRVKTGTKRVQQGYKTVHYRDVHASDWFAPAVACMTSTGQMTGYHPDQFGPNDRVTREQAAVILYRNAGSPTSDGDVSMYPDANHISSWAKNAVAWAAKTQTMNGYGPVGSGATFGPQDSLTREQTAKIIAIAFHKNIDSASSTAFNGIRNHEKTSPWAYRYMIWATDAHVINGWPDARGLDPQGVTSRAQFAQIMTNLRNN